ncbi:DUF543-domain-containing protein, partial [Gonapodya prolifera JEL478]
MAAKISSEEEISRKYDRCLSNLFIKGGIGLSAGVVLSVVFFRKRTWPIPLSTGIGLGISFSECERQFNP